MPLSGTLQDVDVRELVALPQRSGHSGKLFLYSADGAANLFYRDGELVHATLDQDEGEGVVTTVLGWREGKFQFSPGDAPDHETIRVGLEALMRQAAPPLDVKQADPLLAAGSAITELLVDFCQSNGAVELVCVLSARGATAAESGQEERPPELELILDLIHEMALAFPDPALERAVYFTGTHRVVVEMLGQRRTLVLFVDAKAPLGAIFLETSKLARAINAEVSG